MTDREPVRRAAFVLLRDRDEERSLAHPIDDREPRLFEETRKFTLRKCSPHRRKKPLRGLSPRFGDAELTRRRENFASLLQNDARFFHRSENVDDRHHVRLETKIGFDVAFLEGDPGDRVASELDRRFVFVDSDDATRILEENERGTRSTAEVKNALPGDVRRKSAVVDFRAGCGPREPRIVSYATGLDFEFARSETTERASASDLRPYRREGYARNALFLCEGFFEIVSHFTLPSGRYPRAPLRERPFPRPL
jgi:hypothetical protein